MAIIDEREGGVGDKEGKEKKRCHFDILKRKEGRDKERKEKKKKKGRKGKEKGRGRKEKGMPEGVRPIGKDTAAMPSPMFRGEFSLLVFRDYFVRVFLNTTLRIF